MEVSLTDYPFNRGKESEPIHFVMEASEIGYRKTRIHIKSMVEKAAIEKVC